MPFIAASGGAGVARSAACHSLTSLQHMKNQALLQPRPILRPTEVLTLQLDVAASAGSYSVEIVVYGFHRIP